MSGWPLRPLLVVRDREARAAAEAAAVAEGMLRQLQGEVREAAAASKGAASRALAFGSAEATAVTGAQAQRLVAGARAAERARIEAAAHARRAEALEGRALAAGAEVERLRQRLLGAVVRREAVLQLEAEWVRARRAAMERRAEAALDDRPWPGGPRDGLLSASRPAAG